MGVSWCWHDWWHHQPLVINSISSSFLLPQGPGGRRGWSFQPSNALVLLVTATSLKLSLCCRWQELSVLSALSRKRWLNKLLRTAGLHLHAGAECQRWFSRSPPSCLETQSRPCLQLWSSGFCAPSLRRWHLPNNQTGRIIPFVFIIQAGQT